MDTATVTAAAIYCRISSDRGGEALGVARQKKMCEELATRLKWAVADTYVDNDISAYSGSARPEYARLMADIESGLIDGVLCVDIDRLTRQPKELEAFVQLADEKGIALANVSGDVDLRTADGRFRARILGAVARMESEKKSERIRRQRDQAARKGLPQGGRRPFGYEPDGMTLRPAEVGLILEAVERVLAGESLYVIANDWNGRGVLSSSGKAWRVTSLRTMLAGHRIAGLRVHHGEVVADAAWPAIIDRETFEQLQAILGDPRRRRRGRPPTHLLTSLLRCGRCQARLHHSVRPDGATRYVCGKTPGTKSCGRIAVTAEPLEQFISEAVLSTIEGGALAKSLAGTEDSDSNGLAGKLRADELRLEELARDHYVDATIGRAEFLAARQALVARIDAQRAKLAEASNRSVLVRLPDASDSLRQAWADGDVDWRRTVIAAVLDHAAINPGRPGSRKFDTDRVALSWRV